MCDKFVNTSLPQFNVFLNAFVPIELKNCVMSLSIASKHWRLFNGKFIFNLTLVNVNITAFLVVKLLRAYQMEQENSTCFKKHNKQNFLKICRTHNFL